MRDIKFRAWERQMKEMIPVFDIQFHNPNVVEVEGIKLYPKDQQPLMINTKTAWRDAGEIDLMQFTGLTDKNGVEIYEGDVVRIYVEDDWNHVDDKLSAFADYPPKDIEVRFDERFAGYGFDGEELFGKYYTYPLGADEFLFEVIGNIYENPDLLQNPETK